MEWGRFIILWASMKQRGCISLFTSVRLFLSDFVHSIKLNSLLAKLRSLKISFFFSFLQKSGIVLKSSDFSGVDHFSSQNWWFISQIWHDDFLSRKFIQFPDFSGFSSNLLLNHIHSTTLFINYDMMNFFSGNYPVSEFPVF